MNLRSVVLVTLHSPRERIWGLLLDLTPSGITICGIDLSAFEDWLGQLGTEEEMGLSTIFYPLHRVERVAQDERMGKLPSLHDRFRQKTSKSLADYLENLDFK
ncbi:MAG: hypothetical protein U0V70_00930 [Terriglobia bacterium]